MAAGAIPRQAEDFQIERLDGEVILFHPANNTIVHSTETASLIWHLCDGKRTTDDIIALLTAAYPENAETIAIDVPDTLEILAEHRVIVWA